jgi:hypothetical protein
MATKSVGTLSAKLLLDSRGWTAGFASAGSVAKSFATSIAGRVTAAAAGVVGVGAAFHSLGKGMEQVDRHAKLADRLGITVGEVQKLALAADLAGTDVELLARSMLKMGKNIGSGGLPLDKRLFQVADAIAEIKDPAERSARAETIFGKGGIELINVLIQGGQGIRNSANAIDRYGLAISRVDAAKIEAANDAITEMKTVFGGLRNEFAVGIAPSVTSFVQNLTMGMGLLSSYMEGLTEQTKIFTNTLMGAAAFMRGDLATVFQSTMNIERGKNNVKDILKRRQDMIIGGIGSQIGSRAGGLGALGGLSGGSVGTTGAAERGSLDAAKVIAAIQGTESSIDREMLKELQAIARNSDPSRAGAAFGLARL